MQKSQQIVAEFFEHFDAARHDAAFDLMAEDGRWITPGKSPFATEEPRDAIRKKIAGFMALMPNGLRLKPVAWTTEGDRVAVEAVSEAKVANGKIYANEYHFVFEVKAGKIQTVKEYTCTFHAWDVFREYLESDG
jgi:ketosteroid isomerase-like protein